AGPLHHYIVQEELARAGAPELAGRIGINLVGPTLLAHGTPEQKARWLPRVLDASELWCQLFSEPGAGSDLASASTGATRGDAEFNEVFFDGVFVPEDRLVGKEHEGWAVSGSTLTHERGTNPRQFVIHAQLLDELLRLAHERGADRDHRLQQALAQAFVEVK